MSSPRLKEAFVVGVVDGAFVNVVVVLICLVKVWNKVHLIALAVLCKLLPLLA